MDQSTHGFWHLAYMVIGKDTGEANTQGGGQEDGQEGEVDEDDIVKYTILDDWFEPQHYAKAHDCSRNIQSIWIVQYNQLYILLRGLILFLDWI